nr:hypothetical protein [Tanacetum cinerariifolium]
SLSSLTEEIVSYEKENDETHLVKKLDVLCTPESFLTHSNFDTPGGIVYYILKVSADVLLVKGNVYHSVDDYVVAYMKYAAEAGFVVRRSCQKRLRNGDVKKKYLVCKGCPEGIHVDTLDLENTDKQKRNSNLHITGCKARTVFNLDPCTRKFVMTVFDTIHNHNLEREEFKHLSKRERQLTYLEQAFIVKAASVNICATIAHHLLTGIKGSYLLVHGTTIDFKKFFRSVNYYIGDNDAQMLIHKMENRKKHVSDFSFDYLVENAELSGIFWADEVSKYNYKDFGDVVSFDATFKTNNIVVTDQDGAMRNAIKAEFVGFKHRLCMWHITQKLPAKICAKIYDETNFKEKLNKIAWNMYIGPEQFEYRWEKLIRVPSASSLSSLTEEIVAYENENDKTHPVKTFEKAPSIVVTDQDGAMRNAIEAKFAGSNHQLCMWHITQKLHAKICAKIYDETNFKEKLNKIVWNMYIGPEEFEYRRRKLMEEFKLKNHKWSESENSFFSHFTNSGSTLMNFINCFETAMEKQRHVQERMDHKTIDNVHKLKTFLKIERHAYNVYTPSLFELVQKEIFVGLWHCQIDSKSLVEGSEVCIIKESPYVYEIPKKKKKPESVDKGKDKAEENNTIDFFFKKMDFIRRWTKNLIPAALRNKINRYGEKNVVVENFATRQLRLLIILVGVPKPPVVEVNYPTVGSTKGRKKLRIKGGKEKAIEKSLKGRNSCSLCDGTDHNKRTCPRRFEVQDEAVVQNEVTQGEVVKEKVDLAQDKEVLVDAEVDLIQE